MMELWYEGTLEQATIIVRSTAQGEQVLGRDLDQTIEDFMSLLYNFQVSMMEKGYDYELAILPSALINLETSEFYGEFKLISEENGTLSQEVAEGVTFTLEYQNNLITKVNGVTVIFNDELTNNLIPSVPEITE